MRRYVIGLHALRALALLAPFACGGSNAAPQVDGATDAPRALSGEAGGHKESGTSDHEAGTDGRATTKDGGGDATTGRDGGKTDGPAGEAGDGALDGGATGEAGLDGGDGAIADAPPPALPLVVSTTASTDAGTVALPLTLKFGNAGGTPGFVACGTTLAADLPTETFTVTNPNPHTALSWWTGFGSGPGALYKLSTTCTQAAPCSIVGGAIVKVTVTAPAVPAAAGMVSYNDTVTVSSTALADPTTTISLLEASYGAVLTFDPPFIDFGVQPALTAGAPPYSATVLVRNSGNGPYFYSGSPAFTAVSTQFSSPSYVAGNAISVGPGGFGNFLVNYKAVAGGTVSSTDSVGFGKVTAGTCQVLPEPVTVTGQWTTAGVLSFTPLLNFNGTSASPTGAGVFCGATAPSLDVSVTNTSTTSAVNITGLSLGAGAGSAFVIDPQFLAMNPVMPGGTLVTPIPVLNGTAISIPIDPNAVAASSAPGVALDDTLTIQTTDSTATGLDIVALHETTAGAVLSLVPSSLGFSSAGVGGGDSVYPFEIVNSGNVLAPLTLTSSQAAFSFDTNVTAFASATSPANGYFVPAHTGASSGTATVAVAAGTPLCSGSSGSLSLAVAGNGLTGRPYSVSPATVSFATPCGGAAASPAEGFVVLQNWSGQSANWTASLVGAGAAFFTLSGVNGGVATGRLNPAQGGEPGLSALSVTPLPLASNLTQAEAEFGIQATLAVTIGSTATYTVPILETPLGGFPVWQPAPAASRLGALNDGWIQAFTLLSLNAASTTYKVALNPISSSYAISTSALAANLAFPMTVFVQDNARTSPTTSVVVTSTSPLCGPLPPNLAITGL